MIIYILGKGIFSLPKLPLSVNCYILTIYLLVIKKAIVNSIQLIIVEVFPF